ncbi:hypothetical protein MUK42_06231 [Musa troglodytarum]|uniref:Uncharacterized protein n=1 Tax=Musa troglodytarum TaxID=320322 RepID=A0A9E7K928_9LILI|nr:hypothetical protein MUK42_06231 [Musa troglodytarum]
MTGNSRSRSCSLPRHRSLTHFGQASRRPFSKCSPFPHRRVSVGGEEPSGAAGEQRDKAKGFSTSSPLETRNDSSPSTMWISDRTDRESQLSIHLNHNPERSENHQRQTPHKSGFQLFLCEKRQLWKPTKGFTGLC